jgi:hypothetical protein
VLRSLRSRLIFASVLWTCGLLMLMHMASLLLVHVSPVLPDSNTVEAFMARLRRKLGAPAESAGEGTR